MAKRKATSTNSINRQKLNGSCGVVHALDIIAGRWKMLIIYKLEGRKLRFTEIKNKMPGISERMLSLQLKDLEKNGLVSKQVYNEVPLRVEYELTAVAMKLSPIWHALEAWGDMHRDSFSGTARQSYEAAIRNEL